MTSWRILSFNLALKPLDVLNRPTQSTTTSCNPADVDPEYQVYNSHERRARGFLHWLQHETAQNTHPDVLCFQELMWAPLIRHVQSTLYKLGYITHKSIDPLSSENIGSTRMAASGLAVYVRKDRFSMQTGEVCVFHTRIGLDHLARKGFLWCLIQPLVPQEKPFVVVTLHPQAYMEIGTNSPPCGESEVAIGLRALLACERWYYGGYPKAIETVHREQIDDLNDAIKVLRARYQDRILLIGDWNINSFSPRTGKDEAEQDYQKAQHGERKNKEYRELLLHAMHLQPAVRTNRKEFPFSWDPKKIVFARALSGDPDVYQNIDHAFVLRTKTNKTTVLKETLRPMYLKPFPELGAFWSRKSHRCRIQCSQEADAQGKEGYGPIIVAMKLRLKLGIKQRAAALKAFKQLPQPQQTWQSFVLGLPYSESSQLWKGFEFYGIHPEDVGAKWMTEHEPLAIGDVHGYRMLNSVSDHMALDCELAFANYS